MTSTHGAWRHAGVRFLLPGVFNFLFSAFIAALFCAALRCAVTGAQAQKRIVMCCCVALCLRVLCSVCGRFCSSPGEWQSKVGAGQGGGEGGRGREGRAGGSHMQMLKMKAGKRTKRDNVTQKTHHDNVTGLLRELNLGPLAP